MRKLKGSIFPGNQNREETPHRVTVAEKRSIVLEKSVSFGRSTLSLTWEKFTSD